MQILKKEYIKSKLIFDRYAFVNKGCIDSQKRKEKERTIK